MGAGGGEGPSLATLLAQLRLASSRVVAIFDAILDSISDAILDSISL